MVNIYNIAIIAILSSFIILLISITKIREKVQIYSPKLIAQLFSCDFCLSFWIAVIITIVYCIIIRDFGLMYFPFLTTPITRKLL